MVFSRFVCPTSFCCKDCFCYPKLNIYIRQELFKIKDMSKQQAEIEWMKEEEE